MSLTINSEHLHVASDVFEEWIRQFVPVTPSSDAGENASRIGNVEFWIDADGPWANKLSFSIPPSQWDIKRITADLTKLLSGEWACVHQTRDSSHCSECLRVGLPDGRKWNGLAFV